MTHCGSTADIVRNLPILVALRHRFPHADIAWLISENAAPLLLDHWAVNRLIIVQNNWCNHLSEVRRVRKRLQSFNPQVTIDPQNTFGSSLATWLSGAKYRIGFGEKRSRSLHNIHVAAEETHRIEQNRHLLEPFGIVGSSIDFDMPECEQDHRVAQHILHRVGLHGNFALLHLSADIPLARWREERFGVVAKYLLEQWNLPSLITWSGGDESSQAEAAVHAAEGAAHQVPWMPTLVERKSLSTLATLFVGSDTAELQIAAAVGTKCVGLFGPSFAMENSPFGRDHRMIQAPYRGSRKRRKHSSEWMDTISPEMVCAKCDEVLAEILQPTVAVPLPITTPYKRAA